MDEQWNKFHGENGCYERDIELKEKGKNMTRIEKLDHDYIEALPSRCLIHGFDIVKVTEIYLSSVSYMHDCFIEAVREMTDEDRKKVPVNTYSTIKAIGEYVITVRPIQAKLREELKKI